MNITRTNYEEIIIEWSEKKSVKKVEDLSDLINKFDSEERSRLIYQVYGDHHIYGRDVLLYIGISKDISGRFRSHLNGVFNYVNNKSVSIGVAQHFFGKLETVESILIANHKPAFNKEYIHDIDRTVEHKIIVINNGVNYMLSTCCTNFWWVDGIK